MRRITWISIGVIIIIIVTGLGFLVTTKQPVAVSDETRRAYSAEIIVPRTSLLSNIVIRAPHYDASKKIVIAEYRVADTVISVTQQHRPANVTLDQINTRDKFLTNIGSVYVLQGTPRMRQAIIQSESSWIYVNTRETLSYEAYKAFIQTLTIAR